MPDISAHRVECLLKGGMRTILRAIRPDDRRSVIDAFKDADRESIYTRFFAYKKSLSDAELSDLTEVDFDRVVALVATTRIGDREILIAGGRYIVSESASGERTAELSFMTRDDYRGQGVARLLLAHLASIAQQCGIQRLEAVVLPENTAMLSVFRGSGLPVEMAREDGTVHVQIRLRESAGRSPVASAKISELQPPSDDGARLREARVLNPASTVSASKVSGSKATDGTD